jgi:myo-inositol-1(or 4)-monophosphatase
LPVLNRAKKGYRVTADRDRRIVQTLIACGQFVREAVVRAEYHRMADVVGMGADGFATTHVDQLAEETALTFLNNAEPRMNILSEEVGFIDKGSVLTAIVDPIDATNNAVAVPNFVRDDDAEPRNPDATPLGEGHVFGFPYYAFSVGVIEDGELVAGCVMNLPTGEVFTAARGQGVELDGVQVRSRDVTTLDRAVVSLVRPETETAWRSMRMIMTGARRIRITGCSALDLALIACGSLDAMVNPNRISPAGYGEKIVDYAGALALLNEVGGVLTGVDGTPVKLDLDLAYRVPLLGAANQQLHNELVSILGQEDWNVDNL